MKEARYYLKRKNLGVKCTACAWYCEISEGGIGICGVRKNVGGKAFSLVYGRPVSVHIDPMEKKPLYHFLPGSEVLSIGTLGCNFGCGFCQNWDTSQFSKVGNKDEIEEVGYEMPPEQIVDYCITNQIKAVAYTYNEPAVFLEYALDCAELTKKRGIRNIFVTNGYLSDETIPDIAKLIDAANVDLKSFSEKFYRKHCRGALKPVLDAIKALWKSGVWIEITTLVIPGENDTEKELTKIAEFISGVSTDIPWHVSRFHPDYKMMDKRLTEQATLKKAYDIGLKAGLKYVYVSPSARLDMADTYCPKCSAPLISRTGYEVQLTGDFSSGACRKCGEHIPGVWG